MGPHVNTPCLAAPALWGCPCAGTRSLRHAPSSSERPRSSSPLRPCRYLHRLPSQSDAQVLLRSASLGDGELVALWAGEGQREHHRQPGDGHILMLPCAACSRRGPAEEPALQGQHQAGEQQMGPAGTFWTVPRAWTSSCTASRRRGQMEKKCPAEGRASKFMLY